MAGLSTASEGALAPLSSRPFALLWVAGIVSNIGTWMNSTASAWLMTDLAPSALMVSAVQAASNLPMFLFALLAGALADRFDRRRLLLFVQTFLLVTAALFAVLVWLQLVTPPLLLLFTFLMATGAAFLGPDWQATVPMLVPRAQLGQAVALNSIGLNIARAIGPAVAGLLITAAGIAAPFAADTLSFLVVIAALLVWRPVAPAAPVLPPEGLFASMSAGLRFAFASPALRSTLRRAFAYFLFASAVWALLPLRVRDVGGGPSTYGLLLGCIGLGAVLGGLVLPRLKGRMTPAQILSLATVTTAIATALVGVAEALPVALCGCGAMGIGWILGLSTLNVSAQLALPDWIRARGLAIFSTVFFGTMAAGSVAWGFAASAVGAPAALGAAAAGLAMAGVFVRNVPLVSAADAPDHSPSSHWPAPVVRGEPDGEVGPVLVQLRYRVAAENQESFLRAIARLADARRRGGAVRWTVLQDAADPELFVEQFTERSWHAHLRHHGHVSQSDRTLQEAVLAFHDGPAPVADHLLPPGTGKTSAGA